MTRGMTLDANAEKRTCERIMLRKQVAIELPDGTMIFGISENASLGGLLVHSQDKLDRLPMGISLSLYLLEGGKRSRAFPCQVTRISHSIIGLELDKKVAASFGMLLTKGVFKRSK